MAPSTNHVERGLATHRIKGTAQCLAVDGYDAFARLGEMRHEGQETGLEMFRVKLPEYSAERIMAGDTVLQHHEITKKNFFCDSKLSHVYCCLAAAVLGGCKLL